MEDGRGRRRAVIAVLLLLLIVGIGTALLYTSGEHRVTVEIEGQGTADPMDSTVRDNGSLDIVMAPDVGWEVSSVTVDGEPVVTDGNVLELKNITGDHHVKVVFGRIPGVYVLETVSDGGGAIEPSGRTAHASGSVVTVTVTPGPGRIVGDVRLDGVSLGSVGTFDVTMDSDHTVEATFTDVAGTHTVTVASQGHGKVSPSGTVTVAHGQDLVLTFLPDTGYRLSSLEIDGRSVGTGFRTYTLKEITEDRTVRAVFSPIPSPGPTPDPGATGDFTVWVDTVSGTRVSSDGSVERFTEPVGKTLGGNDPFQLRNTVPGISQAAHMELRNNSDRPLTVVLKLDSLTGDDGWEGLAEYVTVTVGGRSVTLDALASSSTWSVDIGTVSPGSVTDMDMTVSFSEDAGDDARARDLSFRLDITATVP